MYEPLFAFLRKYTTLPAGYEEALSSIFQPKHYDAGALLVKEGGNNAQVFFILKGIVRGFYTSHTGKEQTDWFLAENQFVAPSEAYYLNIPCLDSVQALEETDVLTVSFTDLEDLYLKFPETEKIGRRISMQYSFYWRKRFKEFRQTSVADRYKELVTNFPEIIQRVQSQYIASYLNTSRFHLSRIRSKRK